MKTQHVALLLAPLVLLAAQHARAEDTRPTPALAAPGPGVRYWVHPQFAFSAVGGWNGNWYLYDRPSKTVLQGIFAGVQALAVF